LMRMLPGDPAVYLASTPGMGAEEIANIRRELGTDRSIVEQLQLYLVNLGRGNLGTSIVTGRPVLGELIQRLPASLELTGFALLLTLLIAIPLGVSGAIWPNTLVDQCVRSISALGGAIPAFVTGLMFIFVFFYLLGWSPEPVGRLDSFIDAPLQITGFYVVDSILERDGEKLRASVSQMLLPAATMVLFALPPVTRMTRASMLEVLGSEAIRTARALGLSRWTILMTYALRNAAVPIVTTLGIVVSFMLGANVLVEKVFAWPGIGSYALEGLLASDYGPVQGFVLAMSVLFVSVNLMVDLLYGLIDPRARSR
jgi:ABC-type dipeptide/oligopeptide/nickel transport system permease component